MMEQLWDSLKKTDDGKQIRYTDKDIEQLWQFGFVDTSKTTVEEWNSFFRPHRQTDGSYLLSKDDFLALDEYRYKGEIHIPFDAMKINEGKYTDEGFDELVDISISPSCSLSRPEIKKYFDLFKKDFRGNDGLLLIKKDAKERIQILLEDRPSPLRNLEIMFDRMIEARGLEGGGDADTATMQAALQTSSFTETPLSVSEVKAQALQSIEKVKKYSAEKTTAAKENTVELKKVKRSRKGIRG